MEVTVTMAYREYAKTDGVDNLAPSYTISADGEAERGAPLTDRTGTSEEEEEEEEKLV